MKMDKEKNQKWNIPSVKIMVLESLSVEGLYVPVTSDKNISSNNSFETKNLKPLTNQKPEALNKRKVTQHLQREATQ